MHASLRALARVGPATLLLYACGSDSRLRVLDAGPGDGPAMLAMDASSDFLFNSFLLCLLTWGRPPSSSKAWGDS